MAGKLEQLKNNLEAALGSRIASLTQALGEITVEVNPSDYVAAAQILHDDPRLAFAQLMDLCGVDYSAYGNGIWEGRRFAATSQLLSIEHNWRVRIRVFAADDDFPVVETLTGISPGVNWYEPEAYDLFGIMFSGHPDLRRILTVKGFIDHPSRRDSPISGHVEMRYDPQQMRVISQPVTIEPREITPRIIREEQYGDLGRG